MSETQQPLQRADEIETRLTTLGTCAYCGKRGQVAHTGRRLLCLLCWDEHLEPT